MSTDPYVTVENFIDELHFLGSADLCSKEAYGDQSERMDAYLAESIPWPDTQFDWDSTAELAQHLAPLLYGGRVPWGALILSTRGAQAWRREVAA